MNDVNFTTYDVKAIVNYVKNIVKSKGSNYNITEQDIYNIPREQNYAITKLKSLYGNNYIYNLNNIYDDYIIFKGGYRPPSLQATSMTPSEKVWVQTPSGYEKIPVTTTQKVSVLKKVQPHATGFLAGLTGKESEADDARIANYLGQIFGRVIIPATNEVIKKKYDIIIPSPQSPMSSQYRQEPTINEITTPQTIKIEEVPELRELPELKEVTKPTTTPLQEKKIISQMETDLKALSEACKECEKSKKIQIEKFSVDQLNKIVGMCGLCEEGKNAILGGEKIGGNYESKDIFFNDNKPKLIYEKNLYTIESLNKY